MLGCGGVLLALIAVSSAVPGKGLLPEECGQGAQYWCQNLLTAVKCGAVEHCLQSAWNPPGLGEGSLCDECKLIMTTVAAMVKDASLQDGLKRILDNECACIPVKSLVKPCQVMVDTYLTLIVNMLTSFIKPESLCGAVGLCKKDQSGIPEEELLTNQVWEKMLPLWKQDSFNLPTGQTGAQDGPGVDLPIPKPLCWMCSSFIGRLEAAIPKDAIAKSAAQLCLLLPAKLAGVCQCLVEKYTVIVLDLILGQLGPKLLCGLLLMCATEENCGPDMPVILTPDEDLRCETCMAVTAHVKSSLHENSTSLEMEGALIRACNSHHMDWHECLRFIKRHQLQLFAVLGKSWDHKFTCQEIGACPMQGHIPEGSGGCSLGQVYWCQSMANAEECKAVTHCKTLVWG